MSNENNTYVKKNREKRKKEFVNNSGRGEKFQVPKIISKHFNWGAFFFTWIWGLSNKSYITFTYLIAFSISVFLAFTGIPFAKIFCNILSLVLCIWFGINGNKWAWQNKRFNSVEHFHKVQRKWAAAGLIVSIIALIIFTFVIFIMITSVNGSYNKQEIILARKRDIASINQAATLNYALGEGKNIRLTSKGLAEYFALHMGVAEKQGNTLILNDGAVLEFNGDGSCRQYGSCIVKVDVNGGEEPNKEGEDIMILRLQKNNNGLLEIDKSDSYKYLMN